MKIDIVATRVQPDEPCWGLVAGPRKAFLPSGAEDWHWVERYWVIRDDQIAEYSADQGPMELWGEVPPLMIPSFGENSVAQMQEMAEAHRNDDKWIKRRQEQLAASTLMRDIVRNIEEKREYIHNRSQFGPGISKQRNIYDTNVARRKLRDRRKEYSGVIPQGGK